MSDECCTSIRLPSAVDSRKSKVESRKSKVESRKPKAESPRTSFRLMGESQGAVFFERCVTTIEFLNIEQCEMLECLRCFNTATRCLKATQRLLNPMKWGLNVIRPAYRGALPLPVSPSLLSFVPSSLRTLVPSSPHLPLSHDDKFFRCERFHSHGTIGMEFGG